jgi:hypothetical protein
MRKVGNIQAVLEPIILGLGWIANFPFGPFIKVLAGAMVNGKPSSATLGPEVNP